MRWLGGLAIKMTSRFCILSETSAPGQNFPQKTVTHILREQGKEQEALCDGMFSRQRVVALVLSGCGLHQQELA